MSSTPKFAGKSLASVGLSLSLGLLVCACSGSSSIESISTLEPDSDSGIETIADESSVLLLADDVIPAIESFTLINVYNNTPQAGYENLTGPTTVALMRKQLPTFNLVANTNTSVSAVRFDVNESTWANVDPIAPFALGPEQDGNFQAANLLQGHHLIIATPLDGSGQALAPSVLPLTITDKTQALTPKIFGFSLVETTTGQIVPDYTLLNGSVELTIEQLMSANLDLVAQASTDVTRVELAINGIPFKVDDNAPFSVLSDSGPIPDVQAGSVVVTATPFNAVGQAGSPVSLTVNLNATEVEMQRASATTQRLSYCEERPLLCLLLAIILVGLATDVAAPTPTPTPVPTLAATLLWSDSFEGNYMNEEDEDDWTGGGVYHWCCDGKFAGYNPVNPTGNYWAVVDSGDGGVTAVDGNRMYKGVAQQSSNETIRAYPVLHLDEYLGQPYTKPIVNTFYTWAEYGDNRWDHFATYANVDPDQSTHWGAYTFTLNHGKFEFGHVNRTYLPNPLNPSGVFGEAFYPEGRWVKMTLYIDPNYGSDGLIYAWVDGHPYIYGQGGRLTHGGDAVTRFHWGLYGGGDMTGTIYQDDIKLWGMEDPIQFSTIDGKLIAPEPIFE